MQLPRSFYRLPIRFDAARLAEEVMQFAETEWQPHPTGHKGNSCLPLVSRDGDPKNEVTHGPMLPTRNFLRSPYLQQVMASFGAPIGRSRLMRIDGQAEATPHADIDYYWSQHVRIHVPVITFDGVRFLCGPDETFMAAGECWIFNTWQIHNVLNPDERRRIHLVIDTVGSDRFWNLVARAGATGDRDELVEYNPEFEPAIAYEALNYPVVMSPWEASSQFSILMADLAKTPLGGDPQIIQLKAVVGRFLQRWRGLWARFGDHEAGWKHYHSELQRLREELAPFANKFPLSNRIDAVKGVMSWVANAALNTNLAGWAPSSEDVVIPVATLPAPPEKVRLEAPSAPESTHQSTPEPEPEAVPQPLPAPSNSPASDLEPAQKSAVSPAPAARIQQPVFIVAAPGAGGELLLEILSQAAGAYTSHGEGSDVVEGIPSLQPFQSGIESNRLVESDATPQVMAKFRSIPVQFLRDRKGAPPAPNSVARLLDANPKYALRIPFLKTVFPQARFIFVYREPAESIAGIMGDWNSNVHVTYRNLPQWRGQPWSHVLIPEWPTLAGKPLAEIAARQWASANQHILRDLSAVPADRWCAVSYAELVANPQAVGKKLASFTGLTWDRKITPPDLRAVGGETNAKLAAAIEPLLPGLEAVAEKARQACAKPIPDKSDAPPAVNKQVAQAKLQANPGPKQSEQPEAKDENGKPAAGGVPLRSSYSASFARVLKDLGISLFVTTYQAGQLVVLRPDGEGLNTHFRPFPKPMGLARTGNRLAIGTGIDVREFRNNPAAARRVEPEGKHDACFLPRSIHVTGDIQVHELGWGHDELWCVNTAFSCLVTLSPDYSFVPRWRPNFITALAPEDRCHLNGLAMVEGDPRYVTALGESNEVRGWRERKRNGGIIIDLSSNEVIARGLSMPHSPRWYDGRLWVLNSGQGGIGTIDPETGAYQEVARMAGFARGLDFCGRFAFVGLSQVRESSTFSGIAIAERPLEERMCGVCIVDIVAGKVVGHIKFEGAVQEIFAVMVAPYQFPEIVIDDKKLLATSYVVPDEDLEMVPAAFREV